MKASTAQITAYKTSLDKIYKKSLELGIGMCKDDIEREIKENAGFVWDSTKHPEVTTEDMINLIVWCDLYGDQFGLNNDFPPSDNDRRIDLNFGRHG